MAVAALYWAREIFIPLALAIFLAFLLAPLVGMIERMRLGRVFSVVLVVGGGAAALGILGWLVAGQAAGLLGELPKYEQNILAKVRQVRDSIPLPVYQASKAMEQIKDEIRNPVTSQPASEAAVARRKSTGDRAKEKVKPVKVEVVAADDGLIRNLGSLIGPVVHPLLTMIMTGIFVAFFLMNREDLRDRLIRVCGLAHIRVTTLALSDAGNRLSRYLVGHAIVNCINGAAIGCGLGLLGVPNAVLWGVMAAALRFIPVVGTWIAAMFPIGLSIAVFDGWVIPLLAAGWILVVDQLSVNVLEPLFYGHRTGASPTAILFSFVFWAWLWGGIGLLLATPITVMLVVLGKHVPRFEVLYCLFGDAPALPPQIRFYQRVLSLDWAGAKRVAETYAAEHSQQAARDDLMAPTVSQIENDRRRRVIDGERSRSAAELIERLKDELAAAEIAPEAAANEVGQGA